MSAEQEIIVGLDNESSDQEQMIHLITKDKQTFSITRKQAEMSIFITTALSHDKECNEIPLNDFDSSAVQWVVKFVQHHNGAAPPEIEKPLRSKNLRDVTTEYCARFAADLCRNRMLFYKVIELANYLDLKSLLHLLCAKIASLVRGIPIDQIKSTLLNDDPEPEPVC